MNRDITDIRSVMEPVTKITRYACKIIVLQVQIT